MLLIKLIPLFPLIGFLINGLGFRKISKGLAGWLGTGAALLSFVGAVSAYQAFMAGGEQPIIVNIFDWITVGSLNISFSFQIDQLSILMLFVVTGVGTLIHVYSMGYMHDDEGFGKFFAFLNLFLFSMLLLVMGSNYIVMFIGWEGVGLCSYLLIGFWNKNFEYGNAARKAFIMNRVGDLGFLIGIFLIINQFGTVEYLQVFEKAKGLSIGNAAIIAITACLFIGATGKSAQIPLYTWLPDAMAGPTPVSALIHAATMVTSGLYMIVRSNILYTLAPGTLEVVAWVGAATALFAATIGIFQNDIKKVLAYSTVSQLGYMFMAMGVAAYTSGFFHVVTHAFFKALLFLGAGSVIHAMSGEQDIRKMGGLGGKIKITAITFLIGTIAISGIPPFAGFFSKDEILAHVYEHNKIMWVLAVIGSMMTAFYMFRLYFLTFTGSFRGTHEQEHHVHESPFSMTLPLMVLAVFSIVGGFMGIPEIFHFPHALAEFMKPLFAGSLAVNPEFAGAPIDHSTEWMLMGISVAAAVVSILFAYSKFGGSKNVPAEDSAIEGFQKTVYNKYYIDEAYWAIFVTPVKHLSNLFAYVVEPKGFDGIVNGIGNLVDSVSGKVRKLQAGGTGFYLFAMVIGIAVILTMNLGYQVVETIKTFVGIK
ncbi:proton-translocating NADH-quinone oxidoreductase, chain L [Emticicia oligotrophica DSM 17448]|uniref:Proton-translocating NADH-quinone oxidoreductase, chain L n=1 Tax=Emticicia oligotrophica (strain DSM 17448 / CIP 109782 / MTCC 6937 / GPTSA100-15) TaxID=929562 RepID=A0ABM5MZT4_EMTOG|nr:MULTISPECIES: NADH-quinone oxidoreductase subunit L [Emticicia]AFK02627.1 proton-translocating NADH-quinone oxidoreductase, chain L [Emticicia oligotrophica DSM 17448]